MTSLTTISHIIPITTPAGGACSLEKYEIKEMRLKTAVLFYYRHEKLLEFFSSSNTDGRFY